MGDANGEDENSRFFPDLSSSSDDGEISDGRLKIVIESPNAKRKSKTLELDPEEKQLIETVDKELEDVLEEKAAKTNLKAAHVKNIIKQVVTDEHVLALLRHVDNPEVGLPSLDIYEPKLTRAKAKELYPSNDAPNIPWAIRKRSSKVSVLIGDDLQEDSSGDEYVPAEEESEDDRESSVVSDTLSAPSTPSVSCDATLQTSWSEDGVFKIPPAIPDAEEQANIALRTRSKLCLSSTPLEVIEEAFIPPDITTDMYDMECDDDEWRDFLKQFTRPLDEVTRAEDEDHDPEYNVLADEEIDKVDKEELRADRAVKVSRKELNELISELFEYTDIYDTNLIQNTSTLEDEPEMTVLPTSDETPATSDVALQENVSSKDESVPYMTLDQKLLLDQQIRQHVQMLTQNFLLTYQHPEYHEFSLACKEYLVNFKLLAGDNVASTFNAFNLNPAVSVVEKWEQKFTESTDEVEKTKKHVIKTLQESSQQKSAGIHYVPTFPLLVLETISKSEVFLYPALLPRIPFLPMCNFHSRATGFCHSENELVAIGLEEFSAYLKTDSRHLNRNGEINIKNVAYFIQKYIIVAKEQERLYKHIIISKQPREPSNPIKYYFVNGKAPFTYHYVVPLDVLGVAAPKGRKEDALPYQWKEYIYPISTERQNNSLSACVTPARNIPNRVPLAKTLDYNKTLTSKNRKINIPKPATFSTPISSSSKRRYTRHTTSIVRQVAHRKRLENHFRSPFLRQKLSSLIQNSTIKHLKFNSSIFNKLRKPGKPTTVNSNQGMPRSMPTLIGGDTTEPVQENDCTVDNNESASVLIVDDTHNPAKDNFADINSLMMASSTVKTMCKKFPSGAEKKRAKLRRNFAANLAMLSPEDAATAEEKANIYAQAYYDKVREQLEVDDYHKFMEALNSHDEKKDSTVDLYRKMEAIFSSKHQDLQEEFLTFLTPLEAKSVGKLIPHFLLRNMSLFLRKLEIYFKDQPSHVKRIYRSISELSTCVDVSMERVKNTILPLLKGNKLLTDWFLQIFPTECPPEGLLNGVWENYELSPEPPIEGDDGYETINIPEEEDPFGGPNCVCSCHDVEDPAFKARSRHCVSCGLKFMQGRVYIHTGKGLRLANVSFENGSPAEHLKRLNCPATSKQKRRSDHSPSKQTTSPTKDSFFYDTEDETIECGKKRSRQSSKSPRKRKSNKQMEKNGKTEAAKCRMSPTTEKKINVVIDAVINNVEEEKVKLEKPVESVEQNAEHTTSDSSVNEIKPAGGDEVMEWDCNTSIESVELRLSPEPSADSESEFCEESSQDNMNSGTEDSGDDSYSMTHSPAMSENSNSNTFEQTLSWTRDEDKIILETFQKENNKEQAFQHISELLENRSVAQIKQRFETLMCLLQQMAARANK